MHPIDDLILEHARIKLMLRILEKVNEKIAGGEPASTEDLISGIMFLREFADRHHHLKEEGLLFPKIAKNIIPEEIGLINVLLKEHEEGRSYVRNMIESISKKEKSQSDFSEIFLDNSKKYIALLDQHINKENAVLFPQVRQSLSETQLEELKKRFKIMDRHIMASDRHEELHLIVHKLETTYL